MVDEPLHLTFEGVTFEAQQGDTVASALLREGVTAFSRGPKYHRPRGPFCLAGTCAQCHMRVDGEPNVPTCQTPVHDGMKVERQNVFGAGNVDLLRAVDFIFPQKLDHHHLMTRFRGLSAATQSIARRLAGIGERPEKILEAVPAELVTCEVVIVGGGPSGLAAARREGGRALLLEPRSRLGGRTLDGLGERPDTTLPPNVEVRLGTWAIGLFEEGGSRFVLARTPDTLVRIAAERVVLAAGGIERPLPFESNDLPGVFAGRGLLRMVRKTGVLPGPRAVVVGTHADALVVARGLKEKGMAIVAVLDVASGFGTATDLEVLPGAQPLRATGRNRVQGLKVRLADGRETKLACDVVAVVLPLAPIYELGAEVGAEAHYEASAGGFVLRTDEQGRSTVPWVSVAART